MYERRRAPIATPAQFRRRVAHHFGVAMTLIGGSLVIGTVLSVCLFFLFISLLFQLVLFISQRLFLVDVREPLWTVAGDTLAPIAGRNLFLVRKSPISPVDRNSSLQVDIGLTFPNLLARALDCPFPKV